ncbi:MAG TPA: hypothetical protein VFN10_21410 [Thermoanaerobaculia bacterium]|nr:hypothetical protein [Thermoanaerobaculia bacterium]
MGRLRSLSLLALLLLTASAASAAELHRELGMLAQMKPVLAMPGTTFTIERNAGDVNEVTTDGMIISTPPAVDVMLARVDKNGDVVTSCVNTEEAAHAFLHRAPEKITPLRRAGE